MPRYCVFCRSKESRLSQFRFWDLKYLLILRYPVRCHTCFHRTYLFLGKALSLPRAAKMPRDASGPAWTPAPPALRLVSSQADASRVAPEGSEHLDWDAIKEDSITKAQLLATLQLLEHSDEISGMASVLRALSPMLHNAYQEGLTTSRHKNQKARAVLRSQLLALGRDKPGENDSMHQPEGGTTNDGVPPARSVR